MLCALLICAFLALVRYLPFLAQHKDKGKYAMYAMKIPVVFLVDVWYRGSMNSACGPVLRWLIDNGWWNESQWPTSHLDYFRYLLVPVSILLLAADTSHLPAIFIHTIGDSFTVAILFASSQKFLCHQNEQNQILPNQLSCRKPSYHSLMLGDPVHCAPPEALRCPSELSEIDDVDVTHTTHEKTCKWSSDLIEVVAVFLVAVVVHSQTSLIIKSQPTRRDPVMTMAVLFAASPLLYGVGFRGWLSSWTNWLICNFCAVAAAGMSLKRSYQCVFDLYRYLHHVNTVNLKANRVAPSLLGFIHLRSYLLCSYLTYTILLLLVTLLNNNEPETTPPGNIMSSFLTVLTASPLAFYCFCLVAACVYALILLAFETFIAWQWRGLGQITPAVHMRLTTSMFSHGVWCYLVDLPVWLSAIIPFTCTTSSTLRHIIQQYTKNDMEVMRSQWSHFRVICFYLVIFMLPPVSAVIIWYNYGLTSPLFISALPSLYQCLQLSGEFIQHVVWAMESWPILPFQYSAYEVCGFIKRGMEYVTIIFHCGVAVFCVYVCLFHKWAWNSVPLILTMLLIALGQYSIIKAANQLKRESIDMVNSLPVPELDDPRLIDDVCPICLTSMDQLDSRETLCSHVFHRQCLISWTEIRRTCPSCQQNLIYDNEVHPDWLEQNI